MAHEIPTVRDAMLIYEDDGRQEHIAVGTSAWYTWLERATLFVFASTTESFTVRKERRHYTGWYWKAYQRRSGGQRHLYLGKSEALTLERLNAAALTLADASPSSLIPIAESWLPPPQEMANTRKESLREITQQMLIGAKMRVPQVSSGLVSRARLLTRLDEGLRYKLTTVIAPAGYGKTSLLSEWACRQRLPLSWLSLGPEENTPTGFWTAVMLMLEHTCPELWQEATSLLQAPQLSDGAIQITLINALAALSRPVVVILDDYHVITHQAIHSGLVALLDHFPANLHLMISARAEPPLDLARLRGHGQLLEIRSTELSFTISEASLFLNETMGFSLSAEEATLLEERTEGWIAGLHLASLALRNSPDISRFLSTFTGGHRYLMDYLAEEVFQYLPKDVQEFLLQTSFLEQLNASLCNAVTGRQGGQAMLIWLERAQLFLLPLDEERSWYRYHHLFAAFLQSTLRQTQPDILSVLRIRASIWYEQIGWLREAIESALVAPDYERAIALIEQMVSRVHAGHELRMILELSSLEHWLAQLPDALVQMHPKVCIACAWEALRQERDESAESWFRAAERSFLHLQALAEPEKTSEAESIAHELGGLRAFAVFAHGNRMEAITLFRRTLETAIPAQAGSPWQAADCMCVLGLGIAFAHLGQYEEAAQVYTKFISQQETRKDRWEQFLAHTNLTETRYAQARLRLAAETCLQVLRPNNTDSDLPLIPGLPYHLLSQLHCEWNELEIATQYVQQGIEKDARWNLEQVRRLGLVTLAYIKSAQDDIAGAQALIEQCGLYPALWRLPAGKNQGYMMHMRLLVEAVRINDFEEKALSFPKYLMLAHAQLMQEQITAAQRYLDLGRQSLKSGEHLHWWLHSQVLQTMVLFQKGQISEAIAILSEVLTRTEPEGYIRLFVDAGKPMIELLQHLLAQPRRKIAASELACSPEYIKKILEASAVVPTPKMQILAKRELEVLRLMAEGLSDGEIALRLTLKESTVKTYAQRIYTKLNVCNRIQAVLKAQKLCLL